VSASSQVLTVSCGTFLCTLKGLDDPFEMIVVIANSLRDLARRDQQLTQTPPVADVQKPCIQTKPDDAAQSNANLAVPLVYERPSMKDAIDTDTLENQTGESAQSKLNRICKISNLLDAQVEDPDFAEDLDDHPLSEMLDDTVAQTGADGQKPLQSPSDHQHTVQFFMNIAELDGLNEYETLDAHTVSTLTDHDEHALLQELAAYEQELGVASPVVADTKTSRKFPDRIDDATLIRVAILTEDAFNDPAYKHRQNVIKQTQAAITTLKTPRLDNPRTKQRPAPLKLVATQRVFDG